MYGGDFDHVRIIPHLSVSFLSVRRFMITSVCLCPLNICPSLHDYSFTRKLTVLLGSAAFSTSPSADLDSSEICQRLTQAEYRLEVAMYQLISLERCSRLATVASEENEREPYDRKVPQDPQADHWPRTAEELPLELRIHQISNCSHPHRHLSLAFVNMVSAPPPTKSLLPFSPICAKQIKLRMKVE